MKMILPVLTRVLGERRRKQFRVDRKMMGEKHVKVTWVRIKIMNNMVFVGLDQKLLSANGGSMNFKDVVNEEENLEGKSKSLTRLDVSENLSEIILGKNMRSEIRQHAHDAEFDANLLLAVLKKYFDSKSDKDYNNIMRNFVTLPSDGLASICKGAIQKIGLRRMRRQKKLKDHDIVLAL